MKNSNYINIKAGMVNAQLDVLVYEDAGVTYAYAPALDLIGCGDNADEAMASFGVVIEDYFEFGLKRGTLEEDLKKHHWVKEKKQEEFSLPKAWMLFVENKQMQSIYNGSFTKETVPVTYTSA